MAEQDRKDLVPSVLNDLIDVDGTPAEGDGLVRSGGVWTPGPAGGLLPENGPVQQAWLAEYDGAALATEPALETAYQATVPEFETWIPEQIGESPEFGVCEFIESVWYWKPTEPGIYSWMATVRARWNGAPNAAARLYWTPPTNRMESVMYSKQTREVTATMLDSAVGLGYSETGMLFASQGMIDAGWAGVMMYGPWFSTPGAERINYFSWSIFVTRQSPGSTFDYYATL